MDRYEFLHAAAAVLIVLLAAQHPRISARLGRRGRALLVAGALFPLVDYLSAAIFVQDSIEFLIRSRWLHSLPEGALAIAGGTLLASFVTGSRKALAGASVWAAGWSIHLALDASTPAGIWIGPPDESAPFDWPAFAEGHAPLIALLVLALLLTRSWPRRARALRWGSWALTALYFAGGGLQYAGVSGRAADLARPGEAWDVAPASPWRGSWQVVFTNGGGHRVAELGPFGAVRSDPSLVPQWNDQPRLLWLLADPVVRRFYFQVFRHPVTKVDESPVRLTLTMREAGDLDAGAPGATFSFETDRDGRERVYDVERFD